VINDKRVLTLPISVESSSLALSTKVADKKSGSPGRQGGALKSFCYTVEEHSAAGSCVQLLVLVTKRSLKKDTINLP
jgi:hypothetical protein